MSCGVLLWGHAADIHGTFVLQNRAVREIYELEPLIASLRPSIETIIERQKASPIDDALEGLFGRSGCHVERKTLRPFCRLEETSVVLAYL
ncbi:hypothetical protein EVAR_57710_1 [Eumeta japonica]|uniref:Uncharacterized protein n=1 Tax=Eumeta variegata TaxID=151549 RepID=A0A4C1Y609_EUMVA|nr:hypothetical protein EVAR_57710_1 [Eumeta japonica]